MSCPPQVLSSQCHQVHLTASRVPLPLQPHPPGAWEQNRASGVTVTQAHVDSHLYTALAQFHIAIIAGAGVHARSYVEGKERRGEMTRLGTALQHGTYQIYGSLHVDHSHGGRQHTHPFL